MILSLSNIHKSYGADVVLEKVTFQISEKEKAAIVGVNGAGKTTLFRIITGEASYDDGQLFIPKDTEIGYLKQNAQIDSNSSIYDEMLDVFSDIITIESRLSEIENEMGNNKGDALKALMDEYSALTHSLEEKDGYSYSSRIRGVLKGLGFSEEEYNKKISTLSGGQKTRVFLGKLLLKRPPLLLLDEPTNHLDIEAASWLEGFLSGYDKAVIIISHDRYFMDNIVTKVIEVENGKSTVYEGNYSYFAQQKEILREIAIKQFNDQQKIIKKQEDVIRTLRSFNREKFVKRAESRQKSLDKLERVEKPESLPDNMHFSLIPKIQSGNDVLSIELLKKSFGENHLFKNISFELKRGEKAAIIGPNGIGKSTLLKILLKRQTADSGHIRLGTNVQIGYYDQEQQQLDESKTIFNEIHDAYPTMTNGEIRNILAAFVFTGDDINKIISSLSGGEKGRVALAKIMLSKANLLVLDEPTNHLDMYSKEILEDAINSYEGTVLYVSHDRYFINRTATKILELEPSKINTFLGDYDYYLLKKGEKSAFTTLDDEGAEKSQTELKSDWLNKKDEQAKIRRQANNLKQTEKRIESIEEEIKSLDAMLFDDKINSDLSKLQDIYDKKTDLENELLSLYEKWELLS